jgi:hypothetical protein
VTLSSSVHTRIFPYCCPVPTAAIGADSETGPWRPPERSSNESVCGPRSPDCETWCENVILQLILSRSSEEASNCFASNRATLAGNPSPVAASAGDHSSTEDAKDKVGASATRIPYKMANYQRTDFQVLIFINWLFSVLHRKISVLSVLKAVALGWVNDWPGFFCHGPQSKRNCKRS